MKKFQKLLIKLKISPITVILLAAIIFITSKSAIGPGLTGETLNHYHSGDPHNIADRSKQIAYGTPYWQWPDPPLRYLPLSLLILFTEPLGTTAYSVAEAYTFVIEYIIIPATLLYTARKLFDNIGAIAVLVSYAVLYSWFPPFRRSVMFVSGFWMYAYAIPPFLLACLHTSKGNTTQTGIYLGIVSLLELLMAGLAAGIVGLSLIRQGNIRGLIRAAGVSILVFLPQIPVGYYHGDYWISSGGKRLKLAGANHIPEGFALVVLLAVVVLSGLFLAHRRYKMTRIWFESVPLVVTTSSIILGLVWVIAVSYVQNAWLGEIIGYMLKFSTMLLFAGFISLIAPNSYLSDIAAWLRKKQRSWFY